MDEGKIRTFPQITPLPWAKLVSLNSNLENISLYKDVNRIGRQSANDFRLSDIKTSLFHCTISKDSQNKCWIQDHSTNGTFIENKVIGKGNKRELQSGDKFYLTNPNKVRPNEVLGFIFSRCEDHEEEVCEKRCREEEIQLEEPKNKFQNKNSKFQEELGEEMKCCICLDFIYQCVTLIPCLHNFCAACFSDWMQKANTCPQCREEAIELKKNHLINNIIDKFLLNNPELKRPKEEYELMDKKNRVKEDRVILKKPEIKPMFKSTSYLQNPLMMQPFSRLPMPMPFYESMPLFNTEPMLLSMFSNPYQSPEFTVPRLPQNHSHPVQHHNYHHYHPPRSSLVSSFSNYSMMFNHFMRNPNNNTR